MTPPTRSGSGSGSASRPIPTSAQSSNPAPRTSSSPTRTASDSSSTATAAAVQLKFGEHTSRPGSAPPLPLPGASRLSGTALLAFPSPAASSNINGPNSSISRRPPSGRGSARSPPPPQDTLDMDSGFQTVAKRGRGGRNARKETPKRNASSPTSPSVEADTRSAFSLNGGDTASESLSPPLADPLSIKPLKRKLSARKIPDTTSVAFPQSIEHALAARTEQLSDLTFGAIPARTTPSTSPTSSSSSPHSVPPPRAPSPVVAARTTSPARTPAASSSPAPAAATHLATSATHQLPPKPAVGPNPPSHSSPPTHRAASPAASKHASGPAAGVSLPPQSSVGHQQSHLQHGGVPSPHYGPQHASTTPSPVTPVAPQMHQGQMQPQYQQQQQQQHYGGSQQHQQSYGQGGYGGSRGGQYQQGGHKNQRAGPNNRHSGSPQQHQYGTHHQQHYQQQQHNASYQQHLQQHQPQAGGMHLSTQQQQSNSSTPTHTPTSATPVTSVATPMYPGMPMTAAGGRPGANMPPQGMVMAAAIPGMPQGIPMYMGPDGPVMMQYYYPVSHMPQAQPQMQSYASSPSQLLAQMKAQQQQQQQPGMYAAPPTTSATTTATSGGGPAGTPAPAPYGQQQPSTNRPPTSTTTPASAPATTVSGMVLPQGVNVPQPQQPPVVQVPAQPIPMSVPAAGAPPGMMPQLTPPPPPASGQMHMPVVPLPMGHSTSPSLVAQSQHGAPPLHSPVTTSSHTPPLGATRPAIRIARKDDPTKTIQLEELATKVTRTTSQRGSTAGQGDDGADTASMATVSSFGGTATTPDAADPDKTTQMGEGQLLAKRQVEENMRRGTKALEIKRPEHPRGGTPSPRPGSSPVVGKAAVKQTPAVADKAKEEVKPRSRSRSKSPSKSTGMETETQGGLLAPSEKAVAKNGVNEQAAEVSRGRSKSPLAKPVAAPVAKPKSPSPARPVASVQQAPTTKSEQAPPTASPGQTAKPRTPSPAKPRAPSPVQEAKKSAERAPSPAPAPKEVKERSPSPPKKQERSPSPTKAEPSQVRSKSPSPVRSGPSSPKSVPIVAETPEFKTQGPERASSPARSTASDLEEGEIRASPTTGQFPEVLQLVDADENGVFRYSRSRLTELCLPDLPLPNGINLAVFADLRGSRGGSSGAGGYDSRGAGGMSRGGSASGSSRGGMRMGMPERAMSTPTPYQGSAPGSGVSTPTRERRPMPMPPGAAAAAAMAASSSGRSMSGRGESRRDGSRRGADRDAASGDREKRGSRRGTKRTGTVDEGSTSSASSMSLPAQTQQPQLAVAGAALQPSERAHGARGVEVLPEDLKPLEKSSTAWVPESVLQKVAPGALPTPASADANLSEGEMEVQREAEYCTQIEKQMRGVLNKLTPENMERLQPRFAESLKYPSALKLIGRLIVRKSFDEPKYASLYASLTLFMYHHIKPLEGMPDDPDGHKAVRSAVRRIIIHECQDQFSRRPKWAHLAKGSISEEQFEEVVKIKSKVLGNMRFVAELFNYAVISKKVMQAILFELTKETGAPAEEDLECLIVLITTTGQHLKDQIGKKEIDELFKTRIVPIVENADLIPRIKFAVMDLVHLWKSNFAKVKVPIPSAAHASAAASSVSRQASGGSRYDRGGERSDRYGRSNNNSTEFRTTGGRNDRGPRDSRGGERGGYDRSSTGGYERGGDWSDRYGGQDWSERSGSGGSGTWSSQQGGPRRGGPGGERERGGDRSSRYGSNEPDARASPEGGFSSRGGSGPRSGTPSNRGGSASRAPASGPGSRASFGGFGALLGDDGNDESEDEPAAPPVRKILARPSQAASVTSPKRTKSPEPARSAPAAPALEVTTDDQAVSRIEKAMKEFLTNFDYQELADQFKKYAKDVVPAALGRSIEIITEEKEKQVRIYGQGLATAVKEGILPAELVISGILSSMIMEEYEDMKVDIPQLDTLTKALCEELTKAMDASLVAPLLAKTAK